MRMELKLGWSSQYVCLMSNSKSDENAAVASGIEAVTVRYIKVMVFVITDVLLTLNSTRADSLNLSPESWMIR